MTPGARNAVRVCLRIQPEEKVTLITDEASLEIARRHRCRTRRTRLPYNAFVLEDVATRPLPTCRRPSLDDMETSQVSIFAVQAQTNELEPACR